MKNAIFGFIAALILVGMISATVIQNEMACYRAGYIKGMKDRPQLLDKILNEKLTEAEIAVIVLKWGEQNAYECGCN